jgi:pyruvate dehydrogenase E2 component (dihydrolipoamide acetyltransferase)
MKGGCFTVSSLGAIGGQGFTPIVNTPEVGILGVSKASFKPVWNGKEFEPRFCLPLCLSYDHRAVNGADAGRFLTHLVGLLTDYKKLL